jgi:hypothetical protein
MSIYRDAESKAAPPWLRGPNGKKFLEETGAEKDVQLDRARQSVLANFPDQGPADALPLIGADRVLPQGAGEATADYQERLRTAWDGVEGWAFAGSHGGLLRALARGGFPTGLASGAIIIQRTKRYSYLVGTSATGTVTFGTHTGWTFDTTPPKISNQFGILFAADVAGLADGTPLAEQLNDIVRTWKPAKARFMGTRIFLAGPWWDFPFGVAWDDGGRNWGDGVSTGTVRLVQP